MELGLNAKCPLCGNSLQLISYNSYFDFGMAKDGDGLVCEYKCVNNNCEADRVVVYKNDTE